MNRFSLQLSSKISLPMDRSAAMRLAQMGGAAARRRLLRRLPAQTQSPRLHLPPRRPPFSSLSLKRRWFCRIAAANSNGVASFSSLHSESFFRAWDLPPAEGFQGPRDGAAMGDGAAWTAVLLGWLGAEHRHLRRFAEMYGARGIRTISFVVPVGELIFDLGKGVEGKIDRLAAELAAWAEGEEADGRERKLLFHTFSNTGWFTYGAILERLRPRSDVLAKIRGCVVDSGADPELNPQVWAAGFSAALFKKSGGSSALASEFPQGKAPGGAEDGDGAAAQAAERPDFAELVVLSILEKLFSVILRLPDVNKRLSKIIRMLSKEQPRCPQLYLYSSADRVIPAAAVERFIEAQRRLGHDVGAHDFRLSPHVDHLRAFPLLYSAKLHHFLHLCAANPPLTSNLD